jgi:hypothetical protein
VATRFKKYLTAVDARAFELWVRKYLYDRSQEKPFIAAVNGFALVGAVNWLSVVTSDCINQCQIWSPKLDWHYPGFANQRLLV